MDFTLEIYSKLLLALQSAGYEFRTFEEYLLNSQGKVVILRHDVDRLPGNSIRMGLVERSMGIRSSYHFRIKVVKEGVDLLKRLIGQGHEIAYHYEDLSLLARNNLHGENLERKAIESFRENLAYLRQYYPVKVISMHGDPLSKIDNRSLWKNFDYRMEGIICESYLDIDYSDVLYLTDTGRSWEGGASNIRDRIENGSGITKGRVLADKFTFIRTEDVITSINDGRLPASLIINTHPQRWNNNLILWFKELIWQGMKNPVKRFLVMIRQ
jgi:hypothetical protein